ncbi:hypothetical protein [uncultured Lactobacillus sp.]|uniref:hypothetical protein n=1 Tax=uncultured Lactobacillus sp. TaxID=153152 RepID=UPI002632E984|nr:hypothetical protein [uncultured Lactobacillus sp.]
MIKLKGFLVIESFIAIIIAVIAVSCLYVTVAENQKNGRELELKTDRAYAYHILNKTDLKQIMVHNRIYQKAGHHHVWDTTTEQTFAVKE